MKIINHQKGNFSYCGESVMYGTIIMSQKEFCDVVGYLKQQYRYAKKHIKTYVRDSLYHTITYTLTKKENPVCLGVCATELLFKKYKLPRYKKQNYQIVIK